MGVKGPCYMRAFVSVTAVTVVSAGAQHATVNPGPTEELSRFTVRCSL